MDFKKQKPIYLQIADTLCERIVAGEWKVDERVPSVRDVAAELGVNPNTVMRAFERLQMKEIIATKRGIGFYVCDDAKEKILSEQKKEFLENEVPEFLKKMELYGITIEEIVKLK